MLDCEVRRVERARVGEGAKGRRERGAHFDIHTFAKCEVRYQICDILYYNTEKHRGGTKVHRVVILQKSAGKEILSNF